VGEKGDFTMPVSRRGDYCTKMLDYKIKKNNENT
jgi:hypothetical protein